MHPVLQSRPTVGTGSPFVSFLEAACQMDQAAAPIAYDGWLEQAQPGI